MSVVSRVNYVDSAVNPSMGCGGCELWNPKKKSCYAGNDTEKRAGHPGYPDSFLEPERFPGRMLIAANWRDLTGEARQDEPWRNGLPRIIFISDMGDSLSHVPGHEIPFDYLKKEIIDVVSGFSGCRHIWFWLTKRPGRMALFDQWLLERDILWPDTLYINMRDAEQNKINNEFYGPIFYSIVAFLAFGFSGKYLIKYYGKFSAARDSRGFEALFGAYTHARVDKDGLQIDGPVKLEYPRMYINDTPFDLTDAYLDGDDHTLLTLKKGIQVRLYVGTAPVNNHQDKPVPKRPKFTWDYVDPKKAAMPDRRVASNRKSIFQEP